MNLNSNFDLSPKITFTESQFFPSQSSGINSDEMYGGSQAFGALTTESSNADLTFDDRLGELHQQYKENGIDIKGDIKTMVKDRALMEQYKTDLCGPVFEKFQEAHPGDPHITHLIENVNRYWDNKASLHESTAISDFLPISAIEFPIMLKQFFSTITKDIIEVEAVSKPEIVKHIRMLYMVDNQTGISYEYPKCMWDGTWEEVFLAGKGHPIDNSIKIPVPCFKEDLIDLLTDGTPGFDKLSWNCYINAIEVNGQRVELKGNGVTVDLSTGGTFMNGDLNFTADNGDEIDDVLSGRIDYSAGTVSLSAAAESITGVYFKGFLSNENNLRTTSVKERRSRINFRIGDGARWQMPFSLEEIDDAAAMLDINYYNRMVDEITKCQDVQESMTIIKYLCDHYDLHAGLIADHNNLESFVSVYYADLATPAGFAGDPFKYRSSAVQYRLRSALMEVADEVKLEGLSWVLAGNPLATAILSEFTEWKQQSGQSIGGIKVNGAYGFATDLGANVRVVASNIYDAYMPTADSVTNERELVLHGYAYPGDKEHITFRHLKYNDHLLNSEGQSAFQSAHTGGGGAYKIITATSRFATINVQGIQMRLVIRNSSLVYGAKPAYATIVGAPWAVPASD